jgi:hypothetical protein
MCRGGPLSKTKTVKEAKAMNKTTVEILQKLIEQESGTNEKKNCKLSAAIK